jgi:glutamate formiminotransferase
MTNPNLQPREPMTKLIECIPNFSEARQPEIIDQVIAAIESVSEVKMLDRSSDLDHNRTVVTFAGTPAGVEDAAFRPVTKGMSDSQNSRCMFAHSTVPVTLPQMMVIIPIDANVDKTQHIADEFGHKWNQRCQMPFFRHFEFQDHNG